MLIELNPSEVSELLQQLYDSFESGIDFEHFLKLLLVRMGLEDVRVTRPSHDGGIDLVARRPGLDGLSRIDEVRYVVQAKRYAPGKFVPIESVRALRGVMQVNEKGLFITTGRFSGHGEAFPSRYETLPIALIDGPRLVRLCIEHKLGFRFRPSFDRSLLLTEMAQVSAPPCLLADPAKGDGTIVKTITANDIRARIISVPWELGSALGASADSLRVEFPPHFQARVYQYQRERRYISGVTEILRRYGLLTANDEPAPRLAHWRGPDEGGMISVTISGAGESSSSQS